MAEIWKGKEVADAITEATRAKVAELKIKGVIPTLALVRVGEKADDIAYERGAIKRCEAADVEVRKVVLPWDVTQEEFDAILDGLNKDDAVHGILVFQPLPPHLGKDSVRKRLLPAKDVDGCTDGSMAGVYSGSGAGFAPCTARAVMEVLKYYKAEISGKKAAVIGRSLVIGRPVAIMLMHENATVVNCHTRTVDVPSITRNADILIAAAGVKHGVTAEFTNPSQIVIDVGINYDEESGGITGDVDFESVADHVRAITPVPGGVGGVTSAILAAHTVEAAERSRAER